MQVVNIQQDTEEWLEFRRDKIGGSSLHKLFPNTPPSKPELLATLTTLGIESNPRSSIKDLTASLPPVQIAMIKAEQSKKDEFYKLVAGLVARPVNFNDYDVLDGVKVGWRERGHILQPEAIATFEELRKVKVNTGDSVWVSDDNPNIMVSPDGYIPAKEITEAVELKCPDNHVVIRAYDEQRYPEEYHEQVLQYFIVNEKLQKLHFLIYTDCIPSLPLQVFTIGREDVADQLELYSEFQKLMVGKAKDLAGRLAF